MSVIELDIFAPTDLDTAIGTITEDDCEVLEFRPALADLGSIQFVINRNNANATATKLAYGNVVKVRIPVIDADYIWGAVLGSSLDTLASEEEEGGQSIQRGGSGLLSWLRNATVPDKSYHGGAGFDPVVIAGGRWTWTGVHPAAIFLRLLAEDAALDEPALAFLATTFSDTLDSDGASWPAYADELSFDAGTDLLQVYYACREASDFDAQVDPVTHELGAYLHFGTDRSSSSFAAGKVKFVAPGNILTTLERNMEGWIRASHAWVGGTDGVFVLATRTGWVTGQPVRYIFIPYPNSKSISVLTAVGVKQLARRELRQDSAEFEIAPGDDELNGFYLPFKHVGPGDDITVHTGTSAAAHDYNNATKRVTALRIVMDEATDDTDDAAKRRSLHVIIETDGEAIGEGAPGSQFPTPLGAPTAQPDTPGTPLITWDFEGSDAFDTTSTYDSGLNYVASSSYCPSGSACAYTDASSRTTDTFAVVAEDDYTVSLDLKVRFDTYTAYVKVHWEDAGHSHIGEELIWIQTGHSTGVTYEVTKNVTAPVGAAFAYLDFSGRSALHADNVVWGSAGTAAVNDPYALPDPGDSPYFMKSDDPRVQGLLDQMAKVGFSWKAPVRVATTAAGTLASSFEDGDTIDGVVLEEGDRILIKDQAAGEDNGIYTVNGDGAPTRATDFDSGDEAVGAATFASEGTANGNKLFFCTTNAPIEIDTTALAFAEMSGGGGPSTGALTIVIDGGGAVISTGVKGDIPIPWDLTFTGWTLLADQSGAIQIDLWADTRANYPPTDADSITNGSEPEIAASGTNAEDLAITDWSGEARTAGDTLRVNVDSITSIRRITLSLQYERT